MAMVDKFGRKINYLRISLTDRCNLRCHYCMPESGVELLRHEDILSFEEICEITRVAVAMGIDKIKLTGGEPLVRRGIITLVEMLAKINGINDFAMTTNGVRLAEFAESLKSAGLHRVNISLDTLDPERYNTITRGGDLQDVLAGIAAAKTAGLTPLKLNCVVTESRNEPDAQAVAEYGKGNGMAVRFIRRMNLAKGSFWVVDGGLGGHCSSCNRLRLTSNGLLRPCLFNDLTFKIKELGIKAAFRLAVEAKPERGSPTSTNNMHAIGG